MDCVLNEEIKIINRLKDKLLKIEKPAQILISKYKKHLDLNFSTDYISFITRVGYNSYNVLNIGYIKSSRITVRCK